MRLRLSWLVVVFYSIFAVSHAAPSCKSVLANGCSFKHDSHQDVFLDCGFISLNEAPKIGKDCSTPKGMVLKLKTLTKQTIQNVPSTLKELTIHVSNLQNLPVDIFDRFVNLKVLRLPNNHLRTLPERTFKHLYKLEKLEVTSNNLNCDCRLRWIKKSNINVDAKCASPSSLANKELKSISLAELCDVDECVSDTHDCSPLATCTNTVGSFDCMCKSGYRGNGRNCVDFNECSLGGSLCDPKTSTCVNTDGSYLCSCKKGFFKKGNVCVDHNECESTNKCAGKHVKCVNTMGSYKCGCQPGFLENESSCIDVDECSTGQHNCSIQATCTNIPGGFKCSCNSGYLGNGHFCVELAEVSMVKRLMQKNRVFSFLVKRKLVPHALIAAASLLLLIPVSLCLCVCCCRRRRRRRRKNKEYERVPTRDNDEFRRSRQHKGRFFRRGKRAPSSLKKPSVKRAVEDDVEPINTYQSTPAPSVPPPPSTSPPPPSTSPPPPSTSPPPPPPPPPPPVKRQPNI